MQTMDNLIINLSLFDAQNVSASVMNNLPNECLRSANAYSTECILKTFCPQMPQYFVTTGIIIVAGIIILSWVKWWFFNYGFKIVEKNILPRGFLGDLSQLETRQYWNEFILNRIIALCVIYICVVVLMNMNTILN